MEDIGLRATLQGANAYIADAKKIQVETGKMGTQMQTAAKEANVASASLVKSLGGVAVAFAGAFVATKVVSGIGDTIKAASDLSETINKAQVVFGDASAAVLKFGDDAAQALGQSKNEAIGAAAAIGNLFLTTGLGQQDAANMSMSIVQLASDLASFNNIDPTEALEKLRSGLVGESEPLRTLGVLLSEEEVSLKAVQLGLAASTKDVTQAAKVQARYALIMEQTTTAQGDFARTSKGLANSQRILSAAWKDIQAQIGSALLPTIASLTSALATGLPKAFKAVQGATDRFLSAIRPVVSGLGDLWKRLSESSRFQSIVHLFKGLADSIGGIASALTRGDIGGALNKLWSSIRNWLVPLGSNIIGALGDISGLIVKWLGDQWAKVDWRAVWKTAKDVASGLRDVVLDVGAWLGEKWQAIKWPEVWKKAGDIAAGLVALTLDVGKWLGERWAEISWPEVWKMAGDIAGGLWQFALDVTDWLGEQWSKVNWADVWKTAGDIWGGITTAGSKVTDWLGKEWSRINWADVWSNVTNIFVTGLTYAQKAADWLGETWKAIDWAGIWGGVTNLFRGAADIVGDVTTWLIEQWNRIDWAAVWKAVTGIGEGLINAGLNIVKEITQWLQGQFGQVDAKEVYRDLPPPDPEMLKTKNQASWRQAFSGIDWEAAGGEFFRAGGEKMAREFLGPIQVLNVGLAGAMRFNIAQMRASIKGEEGTTQEGWLQFIGMFYREVNGLEPKLKQAVKDWLIGMGNIIRENSSALTQPWKDVGQDINAALVDMYNTWILPIWNKIMGLLGQAQAAPAKIAQAARSAGLGGHEVPALAEGGTMARSGMALVGERGPEMVYLPRAATVVPANQTRQILNQQRSFVDNWTINGVPNPQDAAAIIRKELHFARIREGRR